MKKNNLKRMKKTLLLMSLLLGVLPLAAQSNYGVQFSSLLSDNLSLESAIRLGLENNSDFLAAKEEITIAEQKLSEAKFRYLPQFAVQGTATWYDADSALVLPEPGISRLLPATDSIDSNRFYGVGVTATQYIYSGGRINGTLKSARANLKQVQSRYETVKNAVVLDIKKSFTNLLYAQENVAFTQQIWEQVRNWRFSSDTWTRIHQKALVAQIKTRYSQAQSQLEAARLAMLVSLNKELNSPLTISGKLAPVRVDGDLPHFQLWATEFRPELKSAIYALELDSIAIDLALSKRYPDILLNASYERVGDTDLDDENKQISLAVRLPIPYTFSQQVNQKKAEQKKSTLRRAAIEDKIHVQVASSFEQMHFWQQEAQDRQETYEDLSTLVERANRNTPKNDLASLEARREYLEIGQAYLEALRENHNAKAQLEWAIGKDL